MYSTGTGVQKPPLSPTGSLFHTPGSNSGSAEESTAAAEAPALGGEQAARPVWKSAEGPQWEPPFPVCPIDTGHMTKQQLPRSIPQRTWKMLTLSSNLPTSRVQKYSC